MKAKILKSMLCGVLLGLTISACDSEQKIERTHEDHELFSTRKTKPETTDTNSNVKDSIPIPIPSPDSDPK